MVRQDAPYKTLSFRFPSHFDEMVDLRKSTLPGFHERDEVVHFVQSQKDGGEKKRGFQGRQGRKIHFVRFVGSKKAGRSPGVWKSRGSREKKDLPGAESNKKA